jgi:hypothetical protein
MSRTDLLQEEISRFLKSPTPEVLCIRGKWGIGKTFLWQSEIELARIANKIGLSSYSYVSLFGINSLDGLKMGVFENSVQLLADDSDVSEKQLDQAVGLLKKNRRFLELIPVVGKAFEKAGPLYFGTVRDQIICIDDLERRGTDLTITDVLGITSFLKEQRGCKIALLLNDEELRDGAADELAMHFEKVVDTNMRFDPDAVDSVRIALTESDDINKQLSQRCVSLGIANIRVIKRIERTIRQVAPLLSGFDSEVMGRAIQTIALLGWVKWQPSLAPSMEYIKVRNADVPRSLQTELTPKELTWHALLDDYGFTTMDEFDSELSRTIDNGFLDPSLIQKIGGVLDRQKVASRKADSFETAWEPYHSGFADDQDEVLDGIYKAFMPNIETITPLNLDATIRLFRELGRERQADEMLQFYVDNRSADEELWDLENSTFGSDVRDAAVRVAFAKKLSSQKIPVNPVEALMNLSAGNGWKKEMLDAVAKLTKDDFVSIFKTHKGKELRKLVSGALVFGRFTDLSLEMTEIMARAKAALVQIGSESPLNARRISKYGIEISPPTTLVESDGSENPRSESNEGYVSPYI